MESHSPYTFQKHTETVSKKDCEMGCVTMIDPATGWFEIAEVPDYKAFTVMKAAEKTWLTRYPWPSIIQFDHGSKFKEAFTDLVETYQLIPKHSSAKNLQANSIHERIHGNIGDYIQLNPMNKIELPDEDPCCDLVNAIGWAVRALWHSTLQLVFHCQASQPVSYQSDWELI
jgi:transposase InsO family protein